MDLASFAGLDYQVVQLEGQLYKVGVLTLGEWAYVSAWIKANAPRPLSALDDEDLKRLAPADRKLILDRAYEETLAWPPKTGSKGWFLALDNPAGQVALLKALLGKYQPDITEATCEALTEKLTLLEVVPLVLFAMGVVKSPKAPAPPEPSPPATTGTTKSRPPRRRERPAPSATSDPSPTTLRRTGAGRGTTSSR